MIWSSNKNINKKINEDATNLIMLILLTNTLSSLILLSLYSLDISAGKTISIIDSGNNITEQSFMLEKKYPASAGLKKKAINHNGKNLLYWAKIVIKSIDKEFLKNEKYLLSKTKSFSWKIYFWKEL